MRASSIPIYPEIAVVGFMNLSPFSEPTARQCPLPSFTDPETAPLNDRAVHDSFMPICQISFDIVSSAV